MSKTVTIETVDPDPETSTVVHRFRNFGEDVFRELRDLCDVDIYEIDRATTSFAVRSVVESDVDQVEAILRRLLEEHFFSESTTLTWT